MRGATDKASILAHANVVNISAAVVIKRVGSAHSTGSGQAGSPQDEQFLVIKELVDGKQTYNFPSGKAHLEELIEQTARREVVEETGYETELTELVSVYYYRTKGNSNDRKKDRITIRFNFWGRLKDIEQIQRPTKETISLAWVNAVELKQLIDSGSFRNWIATQLATEVLENKRSSLSTVLQFKD